jgi:Imelysin.
LADDLQRLRQDWQNPLSTTSRSYLQLPPPRRLEILRHTLRELLALELPDQLLQFAGSDQSAHHNQFAGDTQQHYLAVLTGVETLLTQGESPLLNQLLTPETAPDWQRQLQNLIAGLNEAMQEKEEGGTSKLASLREQLPLLAVALAGEPADTTAERP